MLKNGTILESTGRTGFSRIQILKFDKCTNKLIRSNTTKKLDNSVFGEGTDLIKLNDNNQYVFQLTWRSRKIYIYNYPNLQKLATLKLPNQIKEGWGLSHDSKNGKIYMTDGSAKVFFDNEELYKNTDKCDN